MSERVLLELETMSKEAQRMVLRMLETRRAVVCVAIEALKTLHALGPLPPWIREEVLPEYDGLGRS